MFKSKKMLSVLLSAVMVLGSMYPMSALATPVGSTSSAKGEAIAVMNSGVKSYNSNSAVKEKFGKNVRYKNSFRFDSGLNITVVTSTTMSTKDLIKVLEQDPNIDYAFPNYKKTIQSVTSDTYSDYQWALDNTGQHGGKAGEDVNAESLWNTANASIDEDAVIAVVDTGVDYTHPDLKDVMWKNPYGTKLVGKYGYDFYNGDSNPIDDNGHGTHCAGIIAAQANNNLGVSGINQSGVKIMALKWLDETGGGFTEDVLACYEYIERAVDLGTNVVAVNNSWGGAGDEYENETFKSVFDSLGKKGVVSVVAAGNSGCDVEEELSEDNDFMFMDETLYSVPVQAGSEYQINVAASNSKGNLASFSNYSSKYVDVCAPGSGILSTVSYNCFNPTIYSDAKKTSLCALYQDYNDELSAGEFGQPVLSDGDKMSFDICNDYFGLEGKSGRVSIPKKTTKISDMRIISIPYTISDPDADYSISVMTSNKDIEFYAYDLPADADIANSENYENYYEVFEGYADYGDDWTHYFADVDVSEDDSFGYSKSTNRQLVFVLFAAEDNAWLELDDLAVSVQGAKAEDFEKYDFYSGTSMATPYVAGAVALVGRAVGDDCNTMDIMNIVENCGRIQPDLEGKTVNSKTLDLTDISKIPPAIYSVNYSSGNVVIKGKFDNVDSVKINGNDVQYTLNTAKTGITVPGSNYLNRKTKIEISNANGSSVREIVLTNSKSFKAIDNFDFTDPVSGFVLPAGEVVYTLSSNGTLTKVYYDEFDEEYISEEDFGFSLINLGLDEDYYVIDSAVYLNNNIYFILKCPLESSNECVYGYNTYFCKYSINDSRFKMLCDLPDNAVESSALAVYKGRLYVIGGYNISDSKYSRRVFKLNSTETGFTKCASLASGVAFAEAVQYDDKLVLIGGADGTDNMPSIQVYDGTSWSKSSVAINNYDGYQQSYSNGDTCKRYDTKVVTTTSGILCTGTFCEALGDSYLYNPVKDTVKSYSYSYKGDMDYILLPIKNSIIVAECEPDYSDIDMENMLDTMEMPGIMDDMLDEMELKCYKVGLKHKVAEIEEGFGNFLLEGSVYGYAEIGDRVTYKVTTDYGYIADKLVVTNNDTGAKTYYTLNAKSASFVVNASSYTVSARVKKVTPGAISSLKVTKKVDPNKCTLTWSKSADAEGYILQKYSDGKWTNVKSLSKSTRSYTVSLKAGTNKYRVRAYKTYNGKKYYTNSSVKTIYLPVRQSITSLKNGDNSFTVKYNKDKNASGYQIQYSRTSRMVSPGSLTVKSNSTVSKTVSKLKSNQTYYVRVRSYKTVNGLKIYGAWSAIQSTKTK